MTGPLRVLRRWAHVAIWGWDGLLDEHRARTSQPDLCPDEVPAPEVAP